MTKAEMPAVDMVAGFATKTARVHGLRVGLRNYGV